MALIPTGKPLYSSMKNNNKGLTPLHKRKIPEMPKKAFGGKVEDFDKKLSSWLTGDVSSFMDIGSMVADAIQANTAQKYGTPTVGSSAASGAASGASAAAKTGSGILTGLGAIGGGIAGLITGKKAKEEQKKQMIAESNEALALLDRETELRMKSIPESRGMYKYGGSIKGTMPKLGRGKMNTIAMSPIDVLPTIAVNPTKMFTKYQNGGKLLPISKDTVEVKGNKHKDGGVKLPNAEVEGGETIAKGSYVFSDKLGFSDIHKRIAKSKAANDKMPVNPISINTAKAQNMQEANLMNLQEKVKSSKGINPSVDANMYKFQDGGPLFTSFNPKTVQIPYARDYVPFKDVLQTPAELSDINDTVNTIANAEDITPKEKNKLFKGIVSKSPELTTALLPNIYSAISKSPVVPATIKSKPIGYEEISLEARREEAKRAGKGVQAKSKSTLPSSAAAAANVASQVQTTRALGKISEEENRINLANRQRVDAINVQTERANVLAENRRRTEEYERLVRDKAVAQANIANISEKIMRDRAARTQKEENDLSRIFEFATEPSKEAAKAISPILQKYVNPETFKAFREAEGDYSASIESILSDLVMRGTMSKGFKPMSKTGTKKGEKNLEPATMTSTKK